MSNAVKNPTKVITGKHTIMSYLNVNEPKTPLGGGTPKYSVSLIIPKSDTATVAKIRAAIVHPIESYWMHFGPSDQTAAIREQMEKQFEELA